MLVVIGPHALAEIIRSMKEAYSLTSLHSGAREADIMTALSIPMSTLAVVNAVLSL